MGSVLVLFVNRPLDLSPFRAQAEISSYSSTKSTIMFSRRTSQQLMGWVPEVIHHCSVLYVSFYLGFLARSPKKELISHYDAVALLREGWQQSAQPIRLKV